MAKTMPNKAVSGHQNACAWNPKEDRTALNQKILRLPNHETY